MIFQDRKHAGRLLAEKLGRYRKMNAIVLALPRGGVPVASEIATSLGAPLEVLVVRKVGAPFQSELGVGALCEDDPPIWNDYILSRLGLEPKDLARTVREESEKVKRQIQLFRRGKKLTSLYQKVAIVVDDGLATGSTMSAALKYLKKRGAAKVVVAIPIAAAGSSRHFREEVDEVLAVEEPEDLISVGQWYKDFSQVTNEEVVHLLKIANKNFEKTIKQIEIDADETKLTGDLTTFSSMKALIVFAHGSGSSRKSPRNQQVARDLNENGFGTLLLDLLTEQEAENRSNVLNIGFLSQRLVAVVRWLRKQPEFKVLPFGFFGASTGAGAALQAASQLPQSQEGVYAIVSRGGRPDLAGSALKAVKAPTLLLVGEKDGEVIELNRQAQGSLINSKLTIVPRATHLFEEPGTLEEVSKQAMAWFHDYLPAEKNDELKQSLQLVEAITSSMVALRKEDDLDLLIHSLKDKRVVMLGESSHGTKEFYELRSLISKRLIRDHGFKFIAVEGDWPDAYRLHKYIQTGEGGNAKAVLKRIHRWPTWMWANSEIVSLAEWLRAYKAGFFGLDVYSLFESIDEVVNYLAKFEPRLAEEVKSRYACFDRFEGSEISYARSLIKYPSGCQKEVLESLQKMLDLRIKNTMQDKDELFSSQQNARIVANAETYYRTMMGADATSWNVRDSHMMETLDRLLERAGEGAKSIVWAHNTHVGDYRATDMAKAGYINLGGLARQSYGEENVALVGFGTYEGEVLAALAWGSTEQKMSLPAAPEESYEYHFHKAAQKKKVGRYYILLENKTHTPFSRVRGHRAVGVVYDPEHERRGNYVPTQLSKRYDAFVFVNRTHALQSLHSAFVRGEFPETWPSGE